MLSDSISPRSGESVGEFESKEGWLEKKGDEPGKEWKKRFFVLKDGRLKYYKKENTKTLQGEIKLDGANVEAVPEDKHKKKFCFEIQTTAKKRVYVLVSDSGPVMQDWIVQIRNAVLRLRRAKSQAQKDKYVNRVLKEQEEAAKRRLGVDEDDDEHGSENESEVSISVTSQNRKPTVSFNLTPQKTEYEKDSHNHADDEDDDYQKNSRMKAGKKNAASPVAQPLLDPKSPKSPSRDDPKVIAYEEWLQETSSHQRRGSGFGTTASETLIPREQHQVGCLDRCTLL